MNSGWIKTYKKLVDWEWYQDSQMVHLLIHLIIKANFADQMWRGQKIKRGDVLTSRRRLSQETGISERSIRTCLERLQATHEVTIKTTHHFSIVTVLNYDSYQSGETSTAPRIDPPTDQRPTHDRPTNIKKTKNNKNINTKKEFDLSFVDVVFMPLVKDFIQYRKEIKKAYKTERGVKQFYNELRKLSNGNYQTAKKLVEHAKGKEWLTVYEIKNETNKRYTGRKNHADERL